MAILHGGNDFSPRICYDGGREARDNEMLLRPHHALCAQFFEGKGYSEAFVKNMDETLQTLQNGNAAVTLTDGCDVLCASCPNNDRGRCTSFEKVQGIDDRALQAMGLRYGEIISWKDLCKKAAETVIFPGRLKDVCRDCQWISLCDAAHQ